MIASVPTTLLSAAHLAGFLRTFPQHERYRGTCASGITCAGWEECTTCAGEGKWISRADALKLGARASDKKIKAARTRCLDCAGRGWLYCECNDPHDVVIILDVRVELVRLQVVLVGLPDVIRACVDDGYLCLSHRLPLEPYEADKHDMPGITKTYDARTVPLFSRVAS